MTKRELLVDTVQHFTLLNRCYDETSFSCFYSPSSLRDPGVQSNGCAIGRWLDKDTAKFFDSDYQNISSISQIMDHKEYKEKLPNWMQIMSIEFLSSIQTLHDQKPHWDSEGITKEGIGYVSAICREHGIDPLTEEELKHKIKE